MSPRIFSYKIYPKDTPTRWNSTYLAIERVLVCKNVLAHVAIDYKDCSALLEINFSILEEIAVILAPLEVSQFCFNFLKLY